MYQIIHMTHLMKSWSMSSNNLYKGSLELGNEVVFEDDRDASRNTQWWSSSIVTLFTTSLVSG